jgi:hypothetical protein
VSREQRLRRLEEQRDEQEPPSMTEAQRDQRLQAVIDLYKARGWQSRGSVDEDKRLRGILGVMVRAAERAAREQPSPGTLASAQCWRERLAAFEATPLP